MTKPHDMTHEVEMTAAVEEARAAIGTPLQVESLRSKLALGLVTAAGVAGLNETSPTVGSGSGPTPLGVTITKLTLLAAALGVVGTAVWLARDSKTGEPGLRESPTSAPVVAQPIESAIGSRTDRGETGSGAPRGNSPDHAATSATAPHTGPTNGTAQLTPPSTARNTARGRTARATGSIPVASTSRGAAPASVAERPRPSEVELLTRAQALVDSQPSAALGALREHELEYPSGLLREERDVLRIDAEWALGQRGAALARARAFIQRYPRSTQTRRFETLLSDHKNEADSKPTE